MEIKLTEGLCRSAGGSNRLDPEEDGWRWERSTHRLGEGAALHQCQGGRCRIITSPDPQVDRSADPQVDRSLDPQVCISPEPQVDRSFDPQVDRSPHLMRGTVLSCQCWVSPTL
ncbi:Hypp4270 [Branchiostoma lanceolatum]|uniref:Hypp4270 protein n=1 Tax=Branchiostoma lanceolatum TaxID=7740 RepID=A0A8K0A654_BRALA|nr:Hypp4270 [Branchiostoma lanceolatum]